ncbi:putative leader peptide [[Kitasatospora] papulosa]
MQYRLTTSGLTPSDRVAGARCAHVLRPRFTARRHIDLRRVCSALCQA